jgi:hypothetical protein
LKLIQRPARIQSRDNKIPGPLQNRLPRRSLHRIVVDQKHGGCHSSSKAPNVELTPDQLNKSTAIRNTTSAANLTLHRVNNISRHYYDAKLPPCSSQTPEILSANKAFRAHRSDDPSVVHAGRPPGNYLQLPENEKLVNIRSIKG